MQDWTKMGRIIFLRIEVYNPWVTIGSHAIHTQWMICFQTAKKANILFSCLLRNEILFQHQSM